MTLDQLRCASAVARLRSFRAAAAHCYISQPSLSAAIAKLEAEFGAPLFHRSTRRVELTALGHQLLPLIDNALDSLRILSDAARHPHSSPPTLLRIGASPLVSMPLLGAVLRPFERKNPGLQLVYKQCFVDGLAGRLESGALDVAIAPSNSLPRRWRRLPFYSDPLYYVPTHIAPESAPTPAHATLRQIARDTFILTGEGCGLTTFVRSLFRKHRLPLSEYPGSVLNYQVAEEWSELGLGSCLLPARKLTVAKSRACPLLHRSRPLVIPFELYSHPKTATTPHITKLLRHFQSEVPTLLRRLGESLP